MSYNQRPGNTPWNWFLLIAGIVAVILLVLWLMGGIVQAQEIDAVPIIPITGEEDTLSLLIKVLALLISTGLLPLMFRYFQAKGHEIEAKHMITLQTAVLNAAALVLDPNMGLEQKRAKAIAYVLSAAPDALKHFGMTDKLEEIWKKVEAKIVLLQAGTVAVEVPATAATLRL